MSAQTPKFDHHSPEVRKLVHEIQQGTFMREGTMLAFPMGFPAETTTIALDESHITTLDVTPEGIVYGGSSGKRAHIFTAMFHGLTGVVFDMKIMDDADHCPAVCCGTRKVAACVNSPHGSGRILTTRLQPLAFDLVQEWRFERPAFDDHGEPAAGEPIVHAVADAAREHMVGITARHLFTFDFESGRSELVAEISCPGRLALASNGNVVGIDGSSHLWSFDPRTRALKRQAVKLPGGAWGTSPLAWARDSHQGLLYTADDHGALYSFHADRGFSASLGSAMLAPVGPMAVTLDGRVFGFCGDGIGKMFCYDPAARQVTDLGVALSVFERRRYGYEFGDAVVGRDGEIVFGEKDNLGHLWLYFPRVQNARA